VNFKEEAETRVRTLQGEVNTLKEEAQTRVGSFEEEVNLKEEAETRVGTLKGEVNSLKFKCNRAEREEKTNTEAHLLTTSKLMEVNGEFEKLKGASDILARELQEKTNALRVAQDGTALDYVINIDKDPNYEASKLQELIAVVDDIFERYSEKDLAKNKNNKHFPFPLKEDGERNAVDQLTYENKIIIEIKSDSILFRTINDLLWKRFFWNKSSYGNFLSFNGWIGEKVFNTTNLLACKVNAIKDKKRKRQEEEEKQQQQQKKPNNGENNRDSSSTGRGVVRGEGGRGAGRGERGRGAGRGERGRGAGRGGGTSPRTPAAAPTTTKVVSPWSQLSEETKRNAAAVGFSQASFEHMEEEKKSSFPSLIQRLCSEQQQQQQHREDFVGSLKYLKSTKAGSIVIQESVRYFTIKQNEDDTWQAYRLNDKKEEGKTFCQCSFCRKWKGSLGITMHMRSCRKNDTPTKTATAKKQINKN
jgi:hypothetical protein